MRAWPATCPSHHETFWLDSIILGLYVLQWRKRDLAGRINRSKPITARVMLGFSSGSIAAPRAAPRRLQDASKALPGLLTVMTDMLLVIFAFLNRITVPDDIPSQRCVLFWTKTVTQGPNSRGRNVSNFVLALPLIGGCQALGWLCMSPHDIIGLPDAAGQSKADACVLAPPKRLGILV